MRLADALVYLLLAIRNMVGYIV